MNLDGAVVAVTGAGRGIGKATVAAFREHGAIVHGGDLDAGTAENHLDVTDRASYEAFVAAVLERSGRMAVYNASKFAAVGLTAAVREELAGTGVSVGAVLPSAVRTGLSSGVPLGRGLPVVEPETVAKAVLRSVRTRRAEITVPGYLAAWDRPRTLMPAALLRLVMRLADHRRALDAVDRAARAAYEARITAQASRH